MNHPKDVVNYLKNSLNRENLETIFVVGSLPEELVGGSDLDIICVIKSENKDEFFEDVKNKMDNFLKDKPRLKYSFFRGPLKYKNKGLIHFLVYVYEKNPKNPKSSELFVNESVQVLNSYLTTGKVLFGKKPSMLVKNVNQGNLQKLNIGIAKTKSKYEILKKKNTINFPQWKKTSNGWKLLRNRIFASKYFRNYLINYFEKRIQF